MVIKQADLLNECNSLLEQLQEGKITVDEYRDRISETILDTEFVAKDLIDLAVLLVRMTAEKFSEFRDDHFDGQYISIKDDTKHYMYEEVMKTIFGNEVFRSKFFNAYMEC